MQHSKWEIKKDDPVSMYLNDIFTVPINLAGLPAISVPAGYDKNDLPLGLQLIGKAFDEQTILNLSLAIEKRANFKRNLKFGGVNDRKKI